MYPMKKFKPLLLTFFLSLLVIMSACNSSPSTEENIRVCPQCNMELPNSNIHTSSVTGNFKTEYFDDVGCMVLWMKKNSIDLNSVDMKVFSNDTKKYINAKKAFYKFNEKTPMMYGFSAYEKKQENIIYFDEVMMKMLRGEHMANPKIRKQILGY